MIDADEPVECICGTTIPPGTDFEPMCRTCDALRLNRLVAAIE